MPETAARCLRPTSKRAGVLAALLERGATGLNRFEAESVCHDHVLPSTISELCGEFGLVIPRKLETVCGHRGKPTECSRYFLSEADAVKVRRLLGMESEQDAAAAQRWQRAVDAERREREGRARRVTP